MRHTSRTLPVALFAALSLAVVSARAGDAPKPPAGNAGKGEADFKGPEIRWATSFSDAVDEAAQRNVPIYLHSHGST